MNASFPWDDYLTFLWLGVLMCKLGILTLVSQNFFENFNQQ